MTAGAQSFSISDRMAAVQAPIVPIVGQLIRDNPGTVSLGQGVVYYGPPAIAQDALDDFMQQSNTHVYGEVDGSPELVALLREKLRSENHIQCSTDTVRVIVTAGANMGFLNALCAITDPGDQVILPAPYYFNHEMAVRMMNCEPVLVDTDDRFQIDPAAVQNKLTPHTRAIVTVSPNNPTGAVYPRETLAAINTLCRERGIYHISDEAYECFHYDGTEVVSPASFDGSADHTVSLFSMSKAYGFASWRIGYMVVPVHLYPEILKAQDTNLICPSAVSQHVAVRILREAPDYWRDKLQTLTRVRERVLSELATLGELIELAPAQGAFYVLAKINTDVDDMALVTRLIREHRVAAIPGSAFGLTAERYLRISYGSLEEQSVALGIDRLIGGLQAVLNEGNHGT